jgi:hypothetical protein
MCCVCPFETNGHISPYTTHHMKEESTASAVLFSFLAGEKNGPAGPFLSGYIKDEFIHIWVRMLMA